jgi:hypothetical protein
MAIKEQFSRIFSTNAQVGNHLSEKPPKKDYYSGIKVWGHQVKGGNRD